MAAKRTKSKFNVAKKGVMSARKSPEQQDLTSRHSVATDILKKAEALALRQREQTLITQQIVRAVTVSPLANEPGLYKDEDDYERVTNSVVARILSGNVSPSAPDEDK